ncbi:MAG: fibronectin type III domain-containing protein [Patescibacteria group bacterium]|nr:fibronectin type III domain-containing protein [Patescibacteria group bacterium]
MESNLISTSNQDIDFAGLTSITDPLSSDGHVIRTQAREAGVGVNAPFLLIFLSQGQSFDIAVLNITQGTLTTTFTEYEYALTQAEADSITDYTDLEIRMEASCNSGTCSAGSSRDRVHVSWVEFAVLDEPIIPPPTLDTVTVVNSTALEINFTSPVEISNILSYDIRRFNGTGFETVQNILNGTILSFIDSELISDTFYRYHVVSVGNSSESVPSNEIGQRTTEILFSARPDSNPSVRWVNGLGNPPCSDLATFECVNEQVRDDNDFIQTTALGTSNTDTDIMTLSDIEDPERSDSHFLKYTVREAGVGTNPVEFEIQLRQGASIIASFTHSSLPTFYTLFSQELNVTATNSITDYNDLEVTLIGRCNAGCSNQERERFNVSFVVFEIEQVKTGKISAIDTISPTTLRLSWQSDDLDAEITNIIIQKENGTDFANIGTVSNTIFAFNDTGLQEQKIFNYRITGQITNGFALPSLTLTGATPPSTSNLNGNGTVLEPNSTNSFTVLETGVIAQTIELFNVNSSSMQLILNDIDSQKLNTYQIINKMNNGSYDNTSKMRNAGAFYGNIYLELLDIDQFISDIANRIIEEVNEG